MEFGSYLMELRKQRGWSQEQLGENINVTRQTVSKWEIGDTTPEMTKLIELADLFGISIDKLVGREDYVSKDQVRQSDMLYFRANYEYKSKRTLFGIPLVHINLGRGMRRAKGILAIGNVATGVLAVGGLSLGVLSFGGISIGLLALGGLAAALALAVGGAAIGTVAVGGFALGIFAVGGAAVGIYSIGGCAIASRVAAGGYATGHIAIGDKVSGAQQFAKGGKEVGKAIAETYPGTWKVIINIFRYITIGS